MTTTNTSGFGGINTVAWTPIEGTGLNPSQLARTNARISDSTQLANTLLTAIQSAVNSGWVKFSLNDLVSIAATPTPQVNAALLANYLNVNINPGTSLSLGEWRKIAADLQNDAALQASKRPVDSGGGIKSVNGRWYVNGQEVSLLDVYMAVRVNQVSNFDDSLTVYMNQLSSSNGLVKAANDWLAKIRALKPSDTSSTVPWSSIQAAANQFSSSHGYSPSVFMPTGWAAVNASGSYNYLKFDTWIEECKNYVSQKDTDNQVAQQKLEQLTNRRSEVLDGLTAFIKSQSQTGQGLSRNLG